jgi:hypothetical protein
MYRGTFSSGGSAIIGKNNEIIWRKIRTHIRLVKWERRHEELGMGGTHGTKTQISSRKSLFSRIFCWHEWEFLRKWKKGFIREYDFLIREGWMDGEQHGTKGRFLISSHCFCEKWRFHFLAKYRKSHFPEEVDVWKAVLKKDKGEIRRNIFSTRWVDRNNQSIGWKMICRRFLLPVVFWYFPKNNWL